MNSSLDVYNPLKVVVAAAAFVPEGMMLLLLLATIRGREVFRYTNSVYILTPGHLGTFTKIYH